MKFICDGLSLSEAVTKVSKACAIRTTAPILECVKVSAKNDYVSLLATDSELSIEKTVKAEVLDEGEICVPGKLFNDFIGKLAGEEVSLSTGERGLEIGYGDSKSYLQVMPADEFPNIDLEIGENSIVLKQEDLKRVIAQTVFCCASDDSRPILKGCLLECKERLEITALDGYRLATTSAEILQKSGENSIICPARALIEISRILTGEEETTTLYTQGGMLMVREGDLVIVTRLYRGDFIKKENVVPKEFSTDVVVDREKLVTSVERAAILNRGDKNNLITLDMKATGIRITSISEYGNMNEPVQGTVTGKETSVSMNAKFLLDALKALEGEKCELHFNGAVSPFILQSVDEKESLYLILPVRNAV